MMIRKLSPRRCPKTAQILRLKRQLEALGFVITDVGPDGVRVNQLPGVQYAVVSKDAGRSITVPLRTVRIEH